MLKEASQVTLVEKNLPANAGDIRDTGLVPESGRSPAERHDNTLHYSFFFIFFIFFYLPFFFFICGGFCHTLK